MKTHLPLLSGIITTSLITLSAIMPLEASQRDLATFTKSDSLESWTSVNDGVMGGISKGGFIRTDAGTMLFSGQLSLANNGGFASVRTRSGELNLSGMSAIVVNARGDGRTYWVDLRLSNQMRASSYRAYLPTTAGEWQETLIPLADFKLQAFGQELPFKPINPAEVTSLGFTLADKKAGSFSLEIASVRASDGDTIPVATGKADKP